MTTHYQLRATIAVPEAHIADANQIALCLGESSADDQTFASANWQDSSGNKYAVASTVAKQVFSEMAGQPLAAPDHAPDMDIEAATRAQSILTINSGQASPDKIAVVLGDRKDSAQDHIAQLGLEPIPQEEPI